MKETLGGLTQEDYKNAVLRRMQVGKIYTLYERVPSGDRYRAKEMIKVKRKYRVKGFHRNIVSLEDRKGRIVTYRYDEVWNMIEGDI